MSSRAEEKERRRQERLAAEQEAHKRAAQRKRLGLVGGGVLAAAIVVVLALVVFAGGDGDESSAREGGGAAIPAVQIENLAEAARAAGCEVETTPNAGRGHTGETVKYETNPPTSGDHDPTPSEDGIYAAGNPPDVEASVHALEHGRILIQYKRGTPAQRISQLETLFDEEVKGSGGYHTLLFENQTNMPYAVAATAWTQALTCDSWNDKVFDALRAFREQYVDKGPEFIP
jgi:Protein of unknown function (DUF3105)